MKNIKRILGLLLVLCTVCALFSSCGKGEIIAMYNGQPVYEKDVEDIVNYQVISSLTLETTQEQQNDIAYNAIRTYVRYKVMEIDLAKKGYKIDEKALKETVEATIATINDSFKGGYDDWRNMYFVSKNFIYEDTRRYMLADLYNQYMKETIEISEEEIKTYYMNNGMNYADPAGYTWTSVYRQVLDDRDEAECAVAETEMLDYLRKVNNGILSFADVKADLLSKYKEEDGYTMINFYSGENFTATNTVTKIENLNQKIAEITAQYGELNPNAEKNSEDYNKYMSYLGECAQAEVFYALQTMSLGEVYSKPIKSIGGYYIIRLDGQKTTNGFKDFESVKDEIYKKIYEDRVQDMFSEYLVELEKAYNVSYLFDFI